MRQPLHINIIQKWAPALFSRIYTYEREAKRSAKARRKKSVKKSECAERERKKPEFVLLLPPTLEAWLQSPKMLGRRKSKGLE
jgi:hypothetical protein